MIYADFSKVRYNYYRLLSSGVGLAKQSVVSGGENTSGINLHVQQLNLPDYHKVMFNRQGEASYHIAGYGQSNEEALTRVMGETIERFSFMSSYHLLKDRVVTASRTELLAMGDSVLSLDYVNLLDNNTHFKPIQENEPYAWFKVYDYGLQKDIYYPMCLVGHTQSFDDKGFPAMSTGTATHVSQEQALCNALIEQLQIHQFMTSWYGAKRLPVVDWQHTCSKECLAICASILALLAEIAISFGFYRHIRFPSLVVPSFWCGLFVVLLIPLLEELVFRGFLWHLCQELAIGWPYFVALSALSFGCAHLIYARINILTKSLWGLVFASVYVAMGNIYISMIAHVLCNVVLLCLGCTQKDQKEVRA